jgi:hypothetical protein
MTQTASMDLFVVPMATFRVLFVRLVLSHDRRRILHWNVTEHPTEAWTVQQLREVFPWDEAPRYLIRDRDAIFGKAVIATIKGMGTEAVVTAISLAKSIREAADRIDSLRVSGLRHRLERELVAPHSAKLF